MALPPEAEMEDSKRNNTKNWITYGLVGFLLGACLISLSAFGLIAYESANPLPTPTPLPTATVAATALLDQAYQALYSDGNPQLVLDILEPHLEEFINPEELSKALEYLGMAEIGLGHYQLATVYLERLCQVSPTPQNYIMLGRVYDSGGDLEHALANYIIYLESDDPSLTADVREIVQDRVDQIQAILTSFTPTPAQ
jgi:tetratricopeptide (TPR) repeat protein